MKIARLSTMVLACCLMAGTALAQPRGERQGRGQGGPGGGRGGMGMMYMMSDDSPMKRLADAIGKLDLTSEQKDKIADLKKEYEPKFKAIREKADKILTDDQKKIVADARKALKDATGDDRREAFQKFGEAMKDLKPTDDQKKQLGDVGKETRELMTDARTKFRDVLTDEQKKKLDEAMPRGPRGGGRGPRGGDGDKKDAPKKEKEST